MLVSVVDDLDGTPAASSHVLALDDQRVRLDLSAENLMRLRAALAPFLGSNGPSRVRPPRASDPPHLAELAWLHGAPRHGRLPRAVLERWRDMLARGESGAPAPRFHRLELDRQSVHLPMSTDDLTELRASLSPFLTAGIPSQVGAGRGRHPVSLADLAREQGVPITAGSLPRPLLEQWRAQVIGAAVHSDPATPRGHV